MKLHWTVLCLVVCLWVWGMAAVPSRPVLAAQLPTDTPTPEPLTPQQLIQLINTVRTGRGLPALIVDPILVGTAQSTADTMAAYNMSGHIGDVRGRVSAAGYGAGDIPWATENYVALPPGPDHRLIILQAWADDEHMRPMAGVNYRHVGAGVSRTADGQVYYVIHAGYTSNRTYKPAPTPGPGTPTTTAVSQIIFAVQTAAPGPDGALVHVVLNGQSLWSIAIAYGTHIIDIQRLNGMAPDYLTIYAGQKLKIPTLAGAAPPLPTAPVEPQVRAAAVLTPRVQAATAPAATPTPEGSTGPLAPEPDRTPEIIRTTLVILAVLGVALVAFGVMFRG
jgi:LysM repeat protein